MVEIAVVQFYICTIATVAISYFSFSDKVTYFHLLFNIAPVVLLNFINHQFLNKLQKCHFLFKNFAYLRKLFSHANRFFFPTPDFFNNLI